MTPTLTGEADTDMKWTQTDTATSSREKERQRLIHPHVKTPSNGWRLRPNFLFFSKDLLNSHFPLSLSSVCSQEGQEDEKTDVTYL